ncbi:hypothetical protein ACI68E_003640 [Malassezia pachydermatis]
MTQSRWDNWGLKLANILSYFLFASSNVYSGLSGHHIGGPVTTYLTPAPWLFGVWSVINTLFLGLLVYQFWPSGHKTVVESLQWRFPALFVLNSLCSMFYSVHGSRVANLVAFGILCLVAGTVSHLYGKLRMGPEPRNWCDLLFIHLPISLYHGFIVIMFFVAAFAVAGVDTHTHKAGTVTKILVFLTLFFLESTAAGYVFYGNGDIAGAVVISLGLLAIAQEQQSSRFIHWSALYVYNALVLTILQHFLWYLVHCRSSCLGHRHPRSAFCPTRECRDG